jgi:hypothetical protein
MNPSNTDVRGAPFEERSTGRVDRGLQLGLALTGSSFGDPRTLDIGRAVVNHVCCFATVFAQLERGGCNAT